MNRLLSLVALALFFTGCQSLKAKKDHYYENYYHPEGTPTPQEQAR